MRKVLQVKNTLAFLLQNVNNILKNAASDSWKTVKLEKNQYFRGKKSLQKKRENFCESTNFDLQTETEITQKYKYFGIKK